MEQVMGIAKKPKVKIDIAEVERLAGMGCSIEHIAAQLGISHMTLYRRKREQKEVQEAITRGRNRSVVKWASKMATLADQGDFRALKFLLVTQGGDAFQEKKQVQTTVSLQGAESTPAMREVLELVAEAGKPGSDAEE